MSFNFIKKWFYDIDKFTYFFAIALVFLGVLMSCSASPAISSRIHIDTYHFFKKHIIYAVLFVFLMTFISMLSRISIINLSYLGFFVCLLLLCVVPFIGSNIKGSHRWFNLGFIAIQPSEFMKPFFIIMNAHFLSLSKTNRLAPFISISMIGAICGLLILQPDFGSILLYSAIWIVQIFLGNSNIVLLACSILPLIIIIGIVGFFFFRVRLIARSASLTRSKARKSLCSGVARLCPWLPRCAGRGSGREPDAPPRLTRRRTSRRR